MKQLGAGCIILRKSFNHSDLNILCIFSMCAHRVDLREAVVVLYVSGANEPRWDVEGFSHQCRGLFTSH